jgi:ribosome-associated protein YbcJ (S4-like RNA binding protein)
VREIAVRGDHITLGQLLKVAGFVGTGGEVKYFLQETSIKVNGEHDIRRGRKLRPGDTVLVEGRDPIRLTSSEG